MLSSTGDSIMLMLILYVFNEIGTYWFLACFSIILLWIFFTSLNIILKHDLQMCTLMAIFYLTISLSLGMLMLIPVKIKTRNIWWPVFFTSLFTSPTIVYISHHFLSINAYNGKSRQKSIALCFIIVSLKRLQMSWGKDLVFPSLSCQYVTNSLSHCSFSIYTWWMNSWREKVFHWTSSSHLPFVKEDTSPLAIYSACSQGGNKKKVPF